MPLDWLGIRGNHPCTANADAHFFVGQDCRARIPVFPVLVSFQRSGNRSAVRAQRRSWTAPPPDQFLSANPHSDALRRSAYDGTMKTLLAAFYALLNNACGHRECASIESFCCRRYLPC